MGRVFTRLVGPPMPLSEVAHRPARYLLPTFILGMAALCLLVSMFVPYWRLGLLAPQYPQGLEVQIYVNKVTGDVNEVDGLNHYIGMRPMSEAAQLERSMAIIAIAALAFLSDLALMGTSMTLKLGVKELLFVALANPLQLFKTAAILSIRSSLEVLGPAGIYATRTYGGALTPMLLGILAAWILLPLGVSYLVFRRQAGLP